jgi:hypothetical protein
MGVLIDGLRAARLAAVLRWCARHRLLPAELIPLLAELDAAADAWWGRPDHFRSEAETAPDLPSSEPAATPGNGGPRVWGTREVGAALNITARRAGQLAPDLGAWRNERGQWQFDPENAVAEYKRRKAS